MSLPHILYLVILFTVYFIVVVSVKVNEQGVVDFSDEHASSTIIYANMKGIKSVNTQSMSHLSGLQDLVLSYNDFQEIPDLTIVSATLQRLYINNNPSLSTAGNVELAVLKRLWFMYIIFTNLTLLTSTCPEDSLQEYTVEASTLDLCDCQHVWLKVS